MIALTVTITIIFVFFMPYYLKSKNIKKNKNIFDNFVDNEFLSRDSLAFRQYLTEITPDIDMSTDVIDKTGKEIEVTIPVTVRFFWPTT